MGLWASEPTWHPSFIGLPHSDGLAPSKSGTFSTSMIGTPLAREVNSEGEKKVAFYL